MMDGTIRKAVNQDIALFCISPEARDLLDVIMARGEEHISSIHEWNPGYQETPYALAYWLVRYSGLVQSATVSEDSAASVIGDGEGDGA